MTTNNTSNAGKSSDAGKSSNAGSTSDAGSKKARTTKTAKTAKSAKAARAEPRAEPGAADSGNGAGNGTAVAPVGGGGRSIKAISISVTARHYEDRHASIAEAAYFRSALRGFAPGHEIEDWLAAEEEIDQRLLGEGRAS